MHIELVFVFETVLKLFLSSVNIMTFFTVSIL